MNGRGMMKNAVQHQIHAERNKVAVKIMMSVEADIWFAQIAQLVADQNSIQHPEKNVVTLRVTKIRYYTLEYIGAYYYLLLRDIIFIELVPIDFLECCETITLSSTNPSFTSDPKDAWGIGTYKKAEVDSRDRIKYRNSDYTADGFGDFILYYEGPNVEGRQNWLVGSPLVKY